jgi:hypothetical protein
MGLMGAASSQLVAAGLAARGVEVTLALALITLGAWQVARSRGDRTATGTSRGNKDEALPTGGHQLFAAGLLGMLTTHLAAAGHNPRGSLGGGALTLCGTSTEMTFEHGTQADQLVLGKGIHHDFLPPAEPRWRRPGIWPRLSPVHHLWSIRIIALVQPAIWPLSRLPDRQPLRVHAGPVATWLIVPPPRWAKRCAKRWAACNSDPLGRRPRWFSTTA